MDGDTRAARRGSGRRTISLLTGTTAAIPLLALVAVLVVCIVEAWSAIRFNGFSFFSSHTWQPGNSYGVPITTNGIKHLPNASFGAFDLIVGTLEVSAIAIVVAFPIAMGGAVLVAERLPRRIAAGVGLCLEVLAGIPSVVYGLWGVLVLGPYLSAHVYPTIAKLPDVPVLNYFRGNVGAGEGLLTAGVVLAVMIIPIIAATTRDLLRQVPTTTKEAAEALGMTDAEVFRTVQLRWVRAGVIGAVVLGLGRALGETIAVAMVSGSIIAVNHNIYGGMTTIAATIVNQLDAALADPTGLTVRVLAEAALVLFAITLLVNVAARMLVRRVAKGVALPVGAGF
jgi:phosphate transport system permease protein